MSKITGRHKNQSPIVPELAPSGRQISADRDIIGIASSGDQAVNIQNSADQITVLPPEAFAPVTAVDAPLGLTNLPGWSRLFVGRTDELVRLDRALAGPGGVVVQAVHGLGGIGKSTLAAHWAANNMARHTLTWWITADSPAGIVTGLASLARVLQPTLANVLPAEALRDRAVQWLASHNGWLMVLDNVGNPADVAPLLAQAPTGRYLITSRRTTGWHSLAETFNLGVLEPAEALDLITRILAIAGPSNLDGTMELCTELGFLPLAVEQAGAYMAQANITPRTYLDLLGEYPAQIYRATAEGGDAERTIARIWHITLDRLADEPLAGQILRILAWYAADAIPRNLLDGIADPLALISAVGRLAAYSMITATPETLTVHRLVQAVARTPELDDQQGELDAIDGARRLATAQLAAAIPEDDPVHWPTWRTLLPHIEALANHASQDTDTETSANVFEHAGAFALEQGQLTLAADFHQRALTSLGRLLGGDHPRTMMAMNNLAVAYREAGDLGRAIPMLEQSLVDHERALGHDHPSTLIPRTNLAHAYLKAGDPGQAILTLEQSLAGHERALGDDHPRTMTVRNILAVAHMEAGHLRQAIPMLEKNLADRQRTEGDDAPGTITSRNNLARAYQKAKDLNRAIPLFEECLTQLERVLGHDHPRTLTTRNNIAGAYMDAGDLARAIPMLAKNLTEQQRLLGNDHPDTLDCRSDLARAYQQAGDFDQAIPMSEQNFADRQRVLGNDHPDVMTSRNNLARVYQESNDLDRAISLFEQNLNELERVLGGDHPKTLAALYSLGGAHLMAGDLKNAIRMFKQSLASQQKVLGNDHPDTLASRHNLAAAYHESGDTSQSFRLFEQNLVDQQRALGADHTDTLITIHYLGLAHLDAGRLDQAIALFEQSHAGLERVMGADHTYTLAANSSLARAFLIAEDYFHAFPLLGKTLSDYQRIRGKDHPDTLTVRSNLAVAYWKTGDLYRAIPLLKRVFADRKRILGSDHPDTKASLKNLSAARHASDRVFHW